MHHRYEHINVPIEIIRTFVSVVENGSLSKAGVILGLSQPAITAQIKRLQMMIGGAVFDRTSGGSTLTARGELMLSHARKILEANDQILLLGGSARETRPVRIGLSTILAEEFLKIMSGGQHEDMTVFCSHSREIEQNLADGYLDVACLANASEKSDHSVHDWNENFVWVRSRNFVISPGNPIPIVCWPGQQQDHPMIQALESSGLAYRIAFTSFDFGARLAATALGVGLMGVPERKMPREPLIVAKDYYLPRLQPLRMGIRVREALSREKVERAVRLLMKLTPDTTSPRHKMRWPRAVGRSRV